MASDEMASWKEIRPGTYARPIGEHETFLKLMGDSSHAYDREHWAINLTAMLIPTGNMSPLEMPDRLRRAWGHLRFQHPSIAVKVATDDDSVFTYTVPRTSEIFQNWMEQTYRADAASSAAEAIATLKPTSSLTLILTPTSGEIVLRTAHWATDGIGILQLLNAFTALAAQPELPDPVLLPWGTEVERLTPSVEEAASIPQLPNEAQKALAAQYTGKFGLASGAIGQSYLGHSTTPPQGTRNIHVSLDPSTTLIVVAKCKTLGLSVTSALHASVALANFALAPLDREGRHYTSTIRFSLKPFLPEPYSSSDYAAGLYTTGWMTKVDPGSTWENLARYYQGEYNRGISREYLNMHREYARLLCELVRTAPSDQDPASDVDISSIGLLEKVISRRYGSKERGIEIHDVTLGVEISTRQAPCFIWTFRDQLHFHIVYNEAYHEAAQMNQMVAQIQSELMAGLGIQT